MPMYRSTRSRSSLLALVLAWPATVGAQDGSGPDGTSPDPSALRFEAAYVADLFKPVRGGRSREAAYTDNLDLIADLDVAALLGGAGPHLRLHIQSNRGSSPSSRVGDLQGVSNIDAPSEWRLYEAWIDVPMAPGRASLLAGVFDLNAEFDVIPAASDLINSSFGIGPEYSMCGANGPSTFPFTALGVRAMVRPRPTVYAGLALLDGVPGTPADLDRFRFAVGGEDGALLAGELGFARRAAAGPGTATDRPRVGRGHTVPVLDLKMAVGGWVYTRRAETLENEPDRGRPWGAYALAQRRLAGGPGPGRLMGFLRIGTAAGDVNRLVLYLGGGLSAFGPVPGRPDDVAALGVAYARNGSPFLSARRAAGERLERAETVVELTYRVQLLDRLQLQPDLQWVIDPGMDPAVGNALVLGLRAGVLVDLP